MTLLRQRWIEQLRLSNDARRAIDADVDRAILPAPPLPPAPLYVGSMSLLRAEDRP